MLMQMPRKQPADNREILVVVLGQLTAISTSFNKRDNSRRRIGAKSRQLSRQIHEPFLEKALSRRWRASRLPGGRRRLLEAIAGRHLAIGQGPLKLRDSLCRNLRVAQMHDLQPAERFQVLE